MTVQFPDIATDLQSGTPEKNLSKQEIADRGLYHSLGKRVLDVFLVTLAIPLVFPLVAILAFIIALRGGRPFYSQLRVGRNGTRYRIWKLRTMIHDADQALEAYLSENPAARTEWETTQKLKKDPRITPFGRMLRKTSLDELPQLWNVLNGTMSLVGPRPMMVEQEAYYPGRRYYAFRPGVTGLWQISDRNECKFRDRAKFDDKYARIISFRTDFRILMATVGVVLRGTGH